MDALFVRPGSFVIPRLDSRPVDAKTIVVLDGDETGQELLEESLRVLSPEVTGVELDFPRFDLSLENRRATRNAVGDAYGAKEWREGNGEDEVAFRTERIERSVCRAVAEFAFQLAERGGARVFGGPKYTVSPVYEGMLKEEMDAAAARHPEVRYEPQLIDATFALLLSSSGDPLVIPSLNRDGDILSDLVLPLFGSIAGSESLLIALDEDCGPRVVMAEAAHGTAPALYGKNVANPMAMILAGAALLGYGDDQTQQAGRAIREASLEAIADGVRTADLGGYAGTGEFTDEVIRRTRQKLEIWSAL